jgi:anti-anti-sigma regulatory factor
VEVRVAAPHPGQTWLAVVPLSAEIDITNSRQVGIDLLAAFPPGVRLVIADMTATTVCDSSGIACWRWPTSRQ